jgi:hypothetical protein
MNAARGVVAVLVLLGVLSCRETVLFENCDDTIKAEARSPDGRYVASVFERNCGATTNYSTLVSLRDATQNFAPGEQGWVFVLSGQADVTLTWESDRLLKVSSTRREAFRSESTWRDVQVSYATKEP